MLELRPFQKEALRRLRKPIHLVCIAPTGSGKSLIYERIAAEPGRRTLLLSPLVALARQQAERLRESGVAVTLHAGVRPKPPPPNGSGTWIISPEALLSVNSFENIRKWRPDFLVVDECHCLHDWGESFRESFLKIPELIQNFKIPRSLWLTATLPPQARQDLRFRLRDPLEWMGEFSIPSNLEMKSTRIPLPHRPAALLSEVFANTEPGIVFVSTRDSTRRIQNLLQSTGRETLSYHAGMSDEERRSVENRFRASTGAVLVATSAFGMGMDYARLRWMVLWQPPSSLLSLAQALGRVGRQRQLRSSATVFWDEADFRDLRRLYGQSPRGLGLLEEVENYLKNPGCRIHNLERYFNDTPHKFSHLRPCARCNWCLPLKDNFPSFSTG